MTVHFSPVQGSVHLYEHSKARVHVIVLNIHFQGSPIGMLCVHCVQCVSNHRDDVFPLPDLTVPVLILQPFTAPSEAPITCCLGLPSGTMLLINNRAPAFTVAFQPCTSYMPQENHRGLTPLTVVNRRALPCSGCINDITVGDVQGLGQSQVR